MLAMRTRYDGKKIRVPPDARGLEPCDVIVLFEEGRLHEEAEWLMMQQESLEKAWDDKKDAVYDKV